MPRGNPNAAIQQPPTSNPSPESKIQIPATPEGLAEAGADRSSGAGPDIAAYASGPTPKVKLPLVVCPSSLETDFHCTV